MQMVSPRRVSPTPPRNSPPNKATAPSGAFCSRTPSPDVTEATARCPDAYLGLAGRLVDAARAVARRHFRQGLAIEDKADHSPVARADREAETVVRETIATAHPGHGHHGGELRGHNPGAGRRTRSGEGKRVK